MKRKVDYYSIIGKMSHTIEDGRIELRGNLNCNDNVLKQFSDLFDEAIIKAKKEVFEDIESSDLFQEHISKTEWWQELKQRHLSPSTEGALNSRTIQSASQICPECGWINEQGKNNIKCPHYMRDNLAD